MSRPESEHQESKLIYLKEWKLENRNRVVIPMIIISNTHSGRKCQVWLNFTFRSELIKNPGEIVRGLPQVKIADNTSFTVWSTASEFDIVQIVRKLLEGLCYVEVLNTTTSQ
ncbi:MAG: hypothetical protein O2840_00560 [bacterium]|nr:hypothetical protein [bacterium]